MVVDPRALDPKEPGQLSRVDHDLPGERHALVEQFNDLLSDRLDRVWAQLQWDTEMSAHRNELQ